MTATGDCATLFTSRESWSRRTSTESVLSIQDKETDFVCDSSDAEETDGRDVEYEPCTEPEDEPPALGDSSGESSNEIISTKVIAVTVGDEGDLEFADSEQTDTDGLDSEVDLCDYWRCVRCRADNNNPLYRYCERCFKVRKNFFPPRPKRKNRRKLANDRKDNSPQETDNVPPLSQDSGVGSQEFIDSQNVPGSSQEPAGSEISLSRNKLKRRAESADRRAKRIRTDVSSDSESDAKVVSPLVKTVSDPSLTVEDVKITKKIISDTAKEIDKANNMCIICLSEPKSGVFVHGRIAHICCCYGCAVKVWAKAKRCPVCNSKVSNVLKAVVM